jgi:hypothetical protein
MLIKLISFIVIGIFSLKLVNSNNSSDIQVINSTNNDNSENQYQEILTKFDKTKNKIIIDGVVYDLKNPNGFHSEEPGYKTMTTNNIIFSLANVFSKKIEIKKFFKIK